MLCWGLQIAPEKKIQRGDSTNYPGYKIRLQKIQPQKIQIRRNQLQTLNDFQKLLGDINWLQPTTGSAQKLSYLFQTLQSDKDVKSPIISRGWERIGSGRDETTGRTRGSLGWKALLCFSFLPSTHSPTGILVQREDNILG